jgi:transcription initiation factor TFIID subunit 6
VSIQLTVIAHWLAVEGVQPSIPQNPTTAEARASELVPKGPGANPSLGALAGNDNVSFKPLVKHVVSKELILFFDKIRGAILDEDSDQEAVTLRESALESVRGDPGLHQLVPYFVQFVAEKVTHSLNNLFVLRQMMELTAAIIANKSLFIDPYVAALAPPVLTCLVGRHLGREGDALKDQYQLRDLSSSLAAIIAGKYGATSHELRPRLVRTCLKIFLDPTRSLGEHYGAISGLTAIGGADGIRALILPNIKNYEWVIRKAQTEQGENDESLLMVKAAIMKAIMSLTKGQAMPLINGANGNADEGAAVEEYLGTIIGSRVAGLGNHELSKNILESRPKPS